jgi:hypothetical protein
MRDDHISAMARTYEQNAVEQLLLVVEQLEICQEMLREDSVASWRAAIILLDHHAEILLRRHAEALFRAGERRGPGKGRTFTKPERKKIYSSFASKLAVASGAGRLGADVEPVLNIDRAAALRLAHVHRNAAYHRDRHNPGVLRLLCLLQFDAVCHLLAATTPSFGIGGLSSESRLGSLSRHGVRPVNRNGMRNAIYLPEAAEQVARSLTADLGLPQQTVQAALAMDLLDRVGMVSGVVSELLEGGMEAHRLIFALANTEFGDRYGSDEQLVELARKSDPWERRDEADADGRLPAKVYDEMSTANQARNERWIELCSNFQPKARLDVATDIGAKAMALVQTSSLGEALGLYQRLDQALLPLETTLPAVVRSWGEMIDQQVDVALGK